MTLSGWLKYKEEIIYCGCQLDSASILAKTKSWQQKCVALVILLLQSRSRER